MGKSVVILTARRFKAFGVEDGKLVHGVLPVLGRPSPVGGDIAQGQPDQLGGGIVAREMPARLDDLAQPGVDALDGIGRVDHPAYRRREGKEGNHPVPGPTPGGSHGGEFLAPRPLREGLQFSHGRFGAGRRVNRLDRRCQRLAILPTGVVEAVANQMHDAGLQRGRREHRGQGLGHALQAVGDGDQDVSDAAGLEIVEDLHPELGALGVLDPQPEDVPRTVRQHARVPDRWPCCGPPHPRES